MIGPLAILYALPIEIKAFEDALPIQATLKRKHYSMAEGVFAGKELLLVKTGMGARAVKDTLDYLFQAYTPHLIISTGFAGGLSPDLKVGDMVIAKTLLSEKRGDPEIEMEPSLWKDAKGVLEGRANHSFAQRYHLCRLVTAESPVTTALEKLALGTEAESQAVDMESWFVAKAAHDKKIPCLVARAVFDTVRRGLPRSDLLLSDDPLSPGKLLRLLLQEPQLLLQGPQFLKMARTASYAISQFLEGFIKLI